MNKGRRAEGLGGKGKLKGEGMKLVAKGQLRKSGTSLDNGGQSSLIGAGGVAEHSDEMAKRKRRVGVAGYEGSP